MTSSLDQIYKNLMYQNTNDIQSEKITERHVIYEMPKLQELYKSNKFSIPYEMSIRGGPNDPYHNLNLPSADHIIVDLQNLDPYFLRNEKQLINAMKDVIQVSNIPLLSYQCHEHESLGFSCAAILIESYLTFFTWPQEGSMILDFYTCGKESLLSIVLDIERAFAISKSDDDDDNNIQVILNWAYETRGFKKKDKKFKNVIGKSNDLESSLLSSLDTTKYKVLSVETSYQKIDIWDTIDADDFPTYQDALEAGLEQGDPRWLSNEVSKPQRDLFLNGIHQVSLILLQKT
jgi:S-adenosylmethionine decarboxylase